MSAITVFIHIQLISLSTEEKSVKPCAFKKKHNCSSKLYLSLLAVWSQREAAACTEIQLLLQITPTCGAVIENHRKCIKTPQTKLT